MQNASLRNRCEREDFLSEYILLTCEDLLFHQSNCYILQLVSTLQSAPCKAPKWKLLMVGWNSNSVWWETTVSVIMMIQIESRILSRIPLPSLSVDGLGREGSHTQIPPPCAGISASWQGVYKNWSGTAASQRRRKSMKQLQKLFCPLTAPSAVSVVQGPSPQTHWMYCSQEMQRGSLFLYQLLRNRVTTGTERRTKKNNFSYARLLRLMASVWGANR